MKNLVYKNNIFFLLGLICLCFTACKKENSAYYDYVNTQQTFNGSAMDYLKAQPKGTFDSLLVILNRYPFLMDSLTNQKVTLFAPVNKNFEEPIKVLNRVRKAEGKTPVYLANADINELGYMLFKYIIRGNRTTDAYINNVDGMALTSIITEYPMHAKYVKLSSSGYEAGGPAVLNFSDTFGSIFITTWITTTTNAVNIKTNNATINIITPIHIFGFDEFVGRLNK
ncbi:hypothetical protein [Pedobacter sp. MW01-1-1]|uniref:hypothetical protein n=1 Tax=Pedobacter sp. MW01-1-1 TaxID=3383027 RepID=UPI003FEF83B9